MGLFSPHVITTEDVTAAVSINKLEKKSVFVRSARDKDIAYSLNNACLTQKTNYLFGSGWIVGLYKEKKETVIYCLRL